MKKDKKNVFGKNIYLLGKDSNGIKYWLESPSWDCGWYWGFGYVETYTNNRNPEKSKDISSHKHIDSSFLGQQGNEYIHNLHDAPLLHEKTFTNNEGWQLGELFTQFYLLQKMAEFTHKSKPGCNITTSIVDHGNLTSWNKQINEKMIPDITKAIIKILAPEKIQKLNK